MVYYGELPPTRQTCSTQHSFASVIIFRMQGSLMCNKCKWAMYILCFINSHLSLLLPAIALPHQNLSARPSVLGFLCLPRLISESCFYPKSISLEATVPFSGSQGTPTLQMVKSFWDCLLQPLPRSGGRR